MGAGITELETTSTLGPIVADPETPFMDKYGPTCPGEGLTLVALPLTFLLTVAFFSLPSMVHFSTCSSGDIFPVLDIFMSFAYEV
jgi:hypothetical protein